MRNLKKVLSLTLALVMLLGMMVVGAGAVETNFPDNDKIEDVYKEAVSVMNALGIFEGSDAQGNLNPTRTLNRAEAAKIMTIVMLGKGGAKGFESVRESQYFTDMKDSSVSWACGYVDYCASVGIIKGNSATTVNPKGTLRSVDFATMLLRAAGVPEKDSLAGADYEIRTIAAAGKYGISDVSRADITRQAAAQMAFEGLFVSPSGEKNSYKVGNTTYENALDAIIAAKGDTSKIEMTTAKDTLATANFKLAKKPTSINGRDGYVWTQDGDEIVGFIPSDDVLYTSTSGTPLANTGVKKDSSVVYYKNGETCTEVAFTTEANKRGNEVTLVDTDNNDKYDKALVVVKTLDEVTGEPVEKNEKVTVPGVVSNLKADKVVGWEGLAEDDKVLVSTQNGVYTLEKLDTVTGVVTKRTGTGASKKTYTVGGESYSVAKAVETAAQEKLDAALGKDDGVKLFVDADGNVWAVESAVKEPVNYAIVLDIVFVKGTTTAGGSDDGTAEALLLLMDGTTKKVKVNTINGAYPTAADGTLKLPTLVASSTNKFLLKDTLAATKATSGAANASAGDYTGKDTAIEAGKYYGVCADATSAATKTYVGVSTTNGKKGNNKTPDALEGVFYLFNDVSGKADTVTLKTVGVNQDTGVANTTEVPAITGAAYAKGEPNIGTSGVNAAAVNDSTVFVLYNETSEKYEVYTGISGDTAMVGLAATPAFQAVVKNNVATHVYAIGAPTVAETKDYVFITNPDYTYDAADKTYSYEGILNGEQTTIVAKHNASPASTFATPETAFDAVGLYEVKMADGKVVAAKDAVVGGNVKVDTRANVSEAGNSVITIGSTGYTYSDDTKVFYVDAEGTVSTGSAANVPGYTSSELTGLWAVVKDGNGANSNADKVALTELYFVLAAAAPGGDEGGSETAKTPVSGKNVNYYEGADTTLADAPAIKALTPGLYTFKEMPDAITDAGDDASKLLLFRWNNTNTGVGDEAALVEIMDSTGTVIFSGYTAELGKNAPHFSYILIGKTTAAEAGMLADQYAQLKDGDYTWRVTIPGVETPVAQGSFSVKW